MKTSDHQSLHIHVGLAEILDLVDIILPVLGQSANHSMSYAPIIISPLTIMSSAITNESD